MTTLALTRSRSFEPLRMIDQAAHLAESTRNQYRKALARYLETGASLTDADQLATYARGLLSSSRAFLKASVKLVCDRLSTSLKGQVTSQTLSSVQSVLLRLEALQQAIQVETPKGQKAHTWLSREQVKALLSSCDDSLQGLRDRVALGLLVGAGLRRAEAASLTFGDVKRQPIGDKVRVVLEVKGKGKSRVVPISDSLADLIS